MHKEWLFKSKGVELVRSTWSQGPRELPSAWQSLDRPRISFPESLLIFGAHTNPEMVIPGGAIALDADREHAVSRVGEPSGQSVWIGLDPSVFDDCSTAHIRRTMRGINSNTGRALLKPDPRSILALRKLVQYADRDVLEPIEVESLLYSIVERMCLLTGDHKPGGNRNAPCKGGGVYKEAVAEALVLIRESKAMTLEEIGAAVHLSPHHFCRVFKRYTGMTIHGYRQHIRLLNAAEDVLESKESLATIASEHGFSDQSHMTRCFNTAFGVAPSLLESSTEELCKVRTMIQDIGSVA